MATETQTVEVSAIVLDSSFQPRQRTEARTIEKYAASMQAGEKFPPIVLAKVSGAYYMVDGWHRLEAMQKVEPSDTVEAQIIETTEREIGWLAIEANNKHGLPLKIADVRKMLRLYIRARKHRDDAGALKSYRRMAVDLGSMVSYGTIRRWMRADHREVFAQMSGENNTAPGGLQRAALKENELVVASIRDLQNVRARLAAITDPQDRTAIIEATEETLRVIKGAGWEKAVSDF
jgi:ParB-like chromosome segregation protein Spo0J